MDAPIKNMPDLAGLQGDDTIDIVIEDVADSARFRELEQLQMRVWGSDVPDVVPSHVLYIAATTGGIVLGARDGDRTIGFVLGFLARRNGRLYHASHMLGIDPDYQGHGTGAALKWKQRDRALAQGLDLMTWTFDPLESRNAYFNLNKLGAMSRTYKTNVYGDMTDELNRGLPSDRLEVEWQLERVPRQAVSIPDGTLSILSDVGGGPALDIPDRTPRVVRIAAPTSVQRLKREAPELALDWRLAQRSAFTWAFERGYEVTGFADGSFILEADGGLDNAN